MDNNDFPQSDNVDWIPVYVTGHLAEAHIVAGRLESEGVPTVVKHAAGGLAIGFTVGSLGRVEVLVHPRDYDTALDILGASELDEYPDETDIFDADDTDFDE